MREIIEQNIKRSIQTKEELLKQGIDEIERAGFLVSDSFKRGGRLFLCGNGGSASDAQHISAELVIRFKSGNNRRALPAMSLNSDTSAITAGANDLGYDLIFARQVEAFAREGDVLIGLTTSGNSPNVREAFKVAKSQGVKTIMLTGKTGGDIAKNHGDLLDLLVRVPADETARIQECHIMIGHILCTIVEKELFDLV